MQIKGMFHTNNAVWWLNVWSLRQGWVFIQLAHFFVQLVPLNRSSHWGALRNSESVQFTVVLALKSTKLEVTLNLLCFDFKNLIDRRVNFVYLFFAQHSHLISLSALCVFRRNIRPCLEVLFCCQNSITLFTVI